MPGSTQPKNTDQKKKSFVKLQLFIWDQIQFTLLFKGWRNCHPFCRKYRKHNIHRDKHEKYLFPLGENTFCSRSVAWDTWCVQFCQAPLFIDDLLHLNKTSPFPGSAILCNQSVNIYKPYQDSDGVIMSQCPFSNYHACFSLTKVCVCLCFREISTTSPPQSNKATTKLFYCILYDLRPSWRWSFFQSIKYSFNWMPL